MGCFLSCIRSKGEEERIQLRPPSRSNSVSCHHLESVKEESVVENELGSLSCNGEKEEMRSHPYTEPEQLTRESQHLQLRGAIQETPTENCQLNKRIAFQEINELDQSSNLVKTLSNNKIQLVARCEQENNPERAIMCTTNQGNNPTSCQNTPATGSCEQTKTCNLDWTLVRNDIGALVSDPNSPYPPVKDAEMQIPETLSSSYKETPEVGKCITPDLKHTHPRDISVIESVELVNENEVAGECSQPKKFYDGTPAVMVSDLSMWLNGIPNTTTKYKEDQRVKWHATPFEERLERILSDEKIPPPRKLVSGRLIQLEE